MTAIAHNALVALETWLTYAAESNETSSKLATAKYSFYMEQSIFL